MQEQNNIIDNDNLLKEIENKKKIVEKKTDIKKIKMIMFYLNEKCYAVDSSYIQEIILDYPVYFLPFVPKYIRGLINRHGEPYTVVDLNQLYFKSNLDAKTFLVLRNKIDNAAILISGIFKIENFLEKDIHPVSSTDDQLSFFDSSLTYEGKEIFIINIKTILERISNDIE